MSCPFSLPEHSNRPSLRPFIQNQLSTRLDDAHQRFHKRMDQLHYMHFCSICKACYPGIVMIKFHDAYTCSCCILERKGHHFSYENNMDPGIQPPVLAALTRVEEMLISCDNPVLQATHAHGGQYKYSGHTICFPQGISNISKYLPHLIP